MDASFLPYYWREIGRLSSGAYVLPCWIGDGRLRPIAGHFAHVSVDDPTQISYTQSAEKGARDIQTRTRPGKYLAKFYSESLSAPEIADMAAEFGAAHAPVSFQLASTPDEIIAVYANGPHSCMKGESPVGVYGAGDLAIAYLGDMHAEVTARVLCWPAKLIFGRTYGDEIRLASALEAKGYRHVTGGSAWYGARLVRNEIGADRFECPYIDGGLSVADTGEYLKFSPHGWPGGTQAGYVGEPEMVCDSCNAELSEDDARHSENGGPYCDDCYNERFSYCESGDHEVGADDMVSVDAGTRQEAYKCEDCAKYDGAQCEDCNSWVSADNARRICEETYCESCADKHSECDACHADGGSDYTVTDDGETLCAECANKRGTCEECGEDFERGANMSTFCRDCRGEIMLAPRGALTRTTRAALNLAPEWDCAVRPIAGRNALLDACEWRATSGDVFALQVAGDPITRSEPRPDGARFILCRVTAADLFGNVRGVHSDAFGHYRAPLGQALVGMGSGCAKLHAETLRPIMRANAGQTFATCAEIGALLRPALCPL
jgi:hypothetical protein